MIFKDPVMLPLIVYQHSYFYMLDVLPVYRKVHWSRGIGLWLVLLAIHAIIDGSFNMRCY